jgi:hypothetical protein
MGLGQGDVTFWTCPNTAHTAVRAEGAVKICEVCGLTSKHTGTLIDRGQADQRQRDLLFLRDLARRIRTARELVLEGDADDGLLRVPAIPALCVDAVADLLGDAPVGAPSGE